MLIKQIKVAGATLNQTPLDWDGNRDRILHTIAQAQDENVAILCLPELCISGYGCEDAFHARGVSEMAWQMLLEIIPHTHNIAVAVGLPVYAEQVVYNAVAWICDGSLRGLVAKQFLAGQDLYYEPRWFKPWPAGKFKNFRSGEISVPIGDVIFDVQGVKVGFEICEDAWVSSRPATQLAAQGVDLILNSSASHFAFDQWNTRRKIVEEGARMGGTGYIYSNLLGCESGRILYDGSVFIASGNRGMVAHGQRFSYKDSLLTSATIDLEVNRLLHRKNTNYQPLYEKVDNCIFCPFPWEKFHNSFLSITPPVSAIVGLSRYEEFTYAVAIGLWDYLRKSRSHAFVVSLSGGADSSTVATLIFIMAKLALKELGWEGFKEKLSHIGWLKELNDEDFANIMKNLLLTVYQSSENSSDKTHDAAENLSKNLNASFFEFEITNIVQNYTSWMQSIIKRPLDWGKDDLALQNIQARVRGPSVWLLANVRNALLLSTSNRSESAVGYATMDGDTCGGLSPIAGIDKAFILQWLKWMEIQGERAIGPMPFLKVITSQKPTAELRPEEAEQTDEEDLMPYLILDAIEKSAIRDRKMPLEVWEEMQMRFGEYSPQQLINFVERFFCLWSRNQWKRERYAPSFHLDDENLDPKTWCRFPILSGSFSKELMELKHAAKTLGLGIDS